MYLDNNKNPDVELFRFIEMIIILLLGLILIFCYTGR